MVIQFVKGVIFNNKEVVRKVEGEVGKVLFDIIM